MPSDVSQENEYYKKAIQLMERLREHKQQNPGSQVHKKVFEEIIKRSSERDRGSSAYKSEIIRQLEEILNQGREPNKFDKIAIQSHFCTLEVDNSADGNCFYYSFAFALMYYLRAEKNDERTETIFDQFKLNQTQKETLSALLKTDVQQPFTLSQKKDIEKNFARPIQEMSTKLTIAKFKKNPCRSDLYVVASNFIAAALKEGDKIFQSIEIGDSNDFSETEFYRTPGLVRDLKAFVAENVDFIKEQFLAGLIDRNEKSLEEIIKVLLPNANEENEGLMKAFKPIIKQLSEDLDTKAALKKFEELKNTPPLKPLFEQLDYEFFLGLIPKSFEDFSPAEKEIMNQLHKINEKVDSKELSYEEALKGIQGLKTTDEVCFNKIVLRQRIDRLLCNLSVVFTEARVHVDVRLQEDIEGIRAGIQAIKTALKEPDFTYMKASENLNQVWENKKYLQRLRELDKLVIKEYGFDKLMECFMKETFKSNVEKQLDKIKEGCFEEFFTDQNGANLQRFQEHLNSPFRWGTDEDYKFLAEIITQEKSVLRPTSENPDNKDMVRLDVEFGLQTGAKIKYFNRIGDVLLRNKGQGHWVILIPEHVFIPESKKEFWEKIDEWLNDWITQEAGAPAKPVKPAVKPLDDSDSGSGSDSEDDSHFELDSPAVPDSLPGNIEPAPECPVPLPAPGPLPLDPTVVSSTPADLPPLPIPGASSGNIKPSEPEPAPADVIVEAPAPQPPPVPPSPEDDWIKKNIKKISEQLILFKQKIETIQFSHPGAYSDALKLWGELDSITESYIRLIRDETVDKLALGINCKQGWEKAIDKAGPALEKELGWGDYLRNVLKKIANFFLPEKSAYVLKKSNKSSKINEEAKAIRELGLFSPESDKKQQMDPEPKKSPDGPPTKL